MSLSRLARLAWVLSRFSPRAALRMRDCVTAASAALDGAWLSSLKLGLLLRQGLFAHALFLRARMISAWQLLISSSRICTAVVRSLCSWLSAARFAAEAFVLLIGGAMFMLQAHPFELQAMDLGAENGLFGFGLLEFLLEFVAFALCVGRARLRARQERRSVRECGGVA